VERPRISSLKALDNMILEIKFTNGTIKRYDAKELLELSSDFEILKEPSIFKLAQVEVGGIGVYWTKNLDISVYDLWEEGITVENSIV
jgi:hypothetical protein